MNRHSASDRGASAPRRGASASQPAAAAREPPSKRDRILQAAIKVFADKGFYNAKVTEIAHEAGVADGTIYLYFKSKDEVLISLFEDRMEEVNGTLRAALAEAASPVEKLRRLVRLHLEMVEKNRHVAEVLIVELRQSGKFLKEYAAPKFGELLRLIAGAVEEGQLDGSLRGDLDPPVIARALFGALDELALEWLLRKRQRTPRRAPARAGARPAAAASSAAAAAAAEGADGRARGELDLAHVAAQLGDLFIDGLRRRSVDPDGDGDAAPSPATRRAS